MKTKFLYVALLTSLVSANSFSAPVLKGKLISHKEWTTEGAKAIFKEASSNQNVKSIAPVGKKEGVANMQFIGASSRLTATKVFANPPNTSEGYVITADGKSHVFLYNDTSSPVFYKVTRYVCVVHKPKDDDDSSFPKGACGSSADEISLDPEGNFSSDTLPTLAVDAAEPGKYLVRITTQISTSEYTMNFYSSDEGEVEVPATLKK